MAYTLDPRKPVGDEVEKVAQSQLGKLDRALRSPQRLGLAKSLHDARKRTKKLRALARLVHPGLGDLYGPTNQAFRDASRELAAARDAHVLVQTLDALVEAVPAGMHPPDVSPARLELVVRRRRVYSTLRATREELDAAAALASTGAGLVASWDLDDDFGQIAAGVTRTYRRFRTAWQQCGETPTTTSFHEWRKRAKYHRYHLELLRLTYPSLMEPWVDEMHRLTDALGDVHDLAMLADVLRTEPDSFGGADVADAVIVLAEGRGAVLRDRAMALGARLASEEPDAVAERLRSWWQAGRAGTEPGRTSLADFA